MDAVQPDSGYYSPNTSTIFPFDDNDDMLGSTADTNCAPTTSTRLGGEERVQLDWQIDESRMCQRRKRSVSDPTGMCRRLGYCPPTDLQIGSPESDRHCQVDAAVQTDGDDWHHEDRTTHQSAVITSALQLELTNVHPHNDEMANQRAANNREIQLVAGRLAMLGDQFFVDWPQQRGVGVFAAVRFRRVFLAGVFLAVPLPPVWMQNLMRWVLG